jgi:hypothetical protein
VDFLHFFLCKHYGNKAKRRKKMALIIFLNLLLFVDMFGTMGVYADGDLVLGDIQTEKDNYIAGEQAKISIVITNTADTTKQGTISVKVTQGSIILLDESSPVSIAGGIMLKEHIPSQPLMLENVISQLHLAVKQKQKK